MLDKNKETKKEVLYYAKLLDEKGLVNTLEGNLSILDRETGKMYITHSGTRKRFLNEDKIAVVNTENGDQIEGTVTKSSEILLHEAAEEVLKIYHLTKEIGPVHNISDDDLEKLYINHPGSRRNRYGK